MSERKIINIVELVSSWVAIIFFLAYGLITKHWHPTWVIFFLIPISTEITKAILQKKLNKVPVALIAIVIYIAIGLIFDVWSPTWIVFVLIPLYYTTINVLFDNEHKERKETKKKNKDSKIIDVKPIDK